jgi:hypothetical protein
MHPNVPATGQNHKLPLAAKWNCSHELRIPRIGPDRCSKKETKHIQSTTEASQLANLIPKMISMSIVRRLSHWSSLNELISTAQIGVQPHQSCGLHDNARTLNTSGGESKQRMRYFVDFRKCI